MSTTIKGLTAAGWPRWSTLGGAITIEQYRTLQAGGSVDVSDDLAKKLTAMGVAEQVAPKQED